LFYSSKFSIPLSSLPSRGTATTEGRNFDADHLEGPSAAEPQFYNKSRCLRAERKLDLAG
jgi:hypothetical protein